MMDASHHCGDCPHGKTVTIVGNGITEPPYLTLVRCPYDDRYYRYPDDVCDAKRGLPSETP